MPYINRCQFMGHAGNDWEFQKFSTGTSLLSGSLAISKGKDKSGKDRGTVWIHCKVWGKYAETIDKLGGVGKGDLVLVSGRWDQNKGKDEKIYESLNVDELTNFTTLGKRGKGTGGGENGLTDDTREPEDYQDGGGDDDADIPF